MGYSEVRAAVSALRAAADALAAASVDTLRADELVEVLDELETLGCRLPTQSHRLLARLQVETTAKAMGARSWRDVLAIRWRLSAAEARRRLVEAELLAPRQTLTGEPMDPVLPATAAGQGRGDLTRDHVTVIREAMDRLPGFVDAVTREQFEADLAGKAAGIGPKELKDDADREIFLLDQDGPEPDDQERARRRGIHKGRQDRARMTKLKGCLTPTAWAAWEAVFAKLAAPGMCNPDDESPCVSGTPTQAQIDADQRGLAQRRHDAMEWVAHQTLSGGLLGQRQGLPASIVVRTTLQDLLSLAGIGVTGGGTVLSTREILQMGAQANWFLAVFDRATGSALDLFRARRTATVAQRLMLIARDGGCTKPGCPTGFYGTQAHHAAADWADGGNTNVDEMGLACGPDNRLVERSGWSTRINDEHDVEWIPPPPLDTGQARVNGYHRHERLHQPAPAESDCSEPTLEVDRCDDGDEYDGDDHYGDDDPIDDDLDVNDPIDDPDIDHANVDDPDVDDYIDLTDPHDDPFADPDFDETAWVNALIDAGAREAQLHVDAPWPTDQPNDHHPGGPEPNAA